MFTSAGITTEKYAIRTDMDSSRGIVNGTRTGTDH
jgi:hypothetical protein